ncbi:MAG: cyclase family protein [Bacteroidia bacterium]|nr:cyclase family protein [Bacteroidia bacterium]
MIVHLLWGPDRVAVDTTQRVEISQPLNPEGPQPQAFGIPPATVETYAVPGFVGDTLRGGSCNVRTYRLTPHGNGTHTESIGHIVDAPVPVTGLLTEPLWPALVLRVPLTPGHAAAEEGYLPPHQPHDHLITRAALEAAAGGLTLPPGGAVVVATGQPRAAQLTSETSPYPTHAALNWLVGLGARHLLLDSASIDRLDDAGHLSNHRLWWGLPLGSRSLSEATRAQATLTEWLAIPDFVATGRYFVAVEAPPLVSDAVPTRVFLYPLGPT